MPQISSSASYNPRDVSPPAAVVQLRTQNRATVTQTYKQSLTPVKACRFLGLLPHQSTMWKALGCLRHNLKAFPTGADVDVGANDSGVGTQSHYPIDPFAEGPYRVI